MRRRRLGIRTRPAVRAHRAARYGALDRGQAESEGRFALRGRFRAETDHMTRKNTRTLDTIANDIHTLERKNIIEIGELLLEANAQCEHGEWLDWLLEEFEWSVATAERYMKVAKLCSNFRNPQNLKLAKTALYELASHKNEEDLPEIIATLAKHATKSRMEVGDAR